MNVGGRHTEFENGVVTAMTGAMMLPPDAREAGERIEHFAEEVQVSLGEARRALNQGDFHLAHVWIDVASVRIDAIKEELERDFRELDARQAEIRNAVLLAFPGMRIVADLPEPA